MANWAALQEQLTDKQVVKRAKHGIHFDNGDGQVLANFSGKPCHYEDGGIWKPIDTKLLLMPDGFYGCPHSPVKVHKDGHVKVNGSDYTQYTALPNAPVGLVDNDRIVREFTGGRQYIYVTEDGFRQEIVLDRKPSLKLADARKLLAVEYGSLPLKYVASLLTATDAAGSVYTYTNNTELVAWLNAAVYPVVIDPDFSANAAAFVRGANVDWATAKSTAAGIGYTFYIGIDSGNRRIYRFFLRFDTSSIGAGATVTQVNYGMTCTADAFGTDTDIIIKKYNWSGQDPLATGNMETAYDGCLAADADDNIWRNTLGISINTQYTSGNLSTAWVSKTGSTYYGLLSRLDSEGTAYPANNAYGVCSNAILTVLYSSGSLLRVNMNAQFHNLSGGMN